MGQERYLVTNPSRLDRTKRWFVTGFCYSYAKFPQSIFDVIRPRLTSDLEVETLLLPMPIFQPAFPMPLDNWQRTVQGIPVGRALQLIPELDAARFKMGGTVWQLRTRVIDIGDPLAVLDTVSMVFLLPESPTHRLRITNVINGCTAVVSREPHD